MALPTLKHDKKFHHDFNVEHIARIEAKQLNVSGELENLEKKKETVGAKAKAPTCYDHRLILIRLQLFVSTKRLLKETNTNMLLK